MEKHVHIDCSKYPIVILTFPARIPSPAQFEEYLRDLSLMLEERKPVVQIFDGSKAKFLPAELRARQAEWIKQNDVLIRQYVLGTAFIITSAVARIILNGIFLIQKPTTPYYITSSVKDALAWSEGQISQHCTNCR